MPQPATRFRYWPMWVLVVGMLLLPRVLILLMSAFYRSDYLLRILLGVTDVQLALAAYFAADRRWHWSIRLPLAGMMGCSGFAGNIVVLITWFYPFVTTEEYLLQMSLPVVLGISFWRWPVAPSEFPTNSVKLEKQNLRPQFSLGALLLWATAAAVCIFVGQRLLVETDVSGMYDPIETVGGWMPWEYTIPRLPLAILSILIWVILFRFCMKEIESQRHWFRKLLSLTRIIALGCVAEIMMGGCLLLGMLMLGLNYPLMTIPISCAGIMISHYDLILERTLPYLMLPLTRLVILTLCGILMRWQAWNDFQRGSSVIQNG